jgi:hypothetical protein
MEASLGQATAVLDNRWNNRRKVASGGLVDFLRLSLCAIIFHIFLSI